MTIKYGKTLVVAAVATLGLLMVAPAQAAGETTGTIHVITVVNNDNHGIHSLTDFQLSVKHFGADVAGMRRSVVLRNRRH